ncbi:MAG TPA: AAA family ATPase, partial [Rhodothermales bacterium]|nr:AAA family ATPase [Rhodothermales bacterium]
MSTLSAADKLSALGVRDTEPDEFQQKKSQGLNAVPSSALEQQIIICNQELEPDPIPDLIEGFAPSQASTTLFARGGRHKTTLGMYAALCVAQGVPFLGEYGVQRGPVFWVDAEGMGRARFLQRLFELCRGMGIERPTGEKVFFFELGVRSLKDVATLEPLAAFVRKHGVVVTFLDSFTSAMRGGDSNSADDVSASMALVRELGTSIVIDHVRKDADENNPTAFGSVAKENLSRSSWAVSSQDGALILRHVK